MHYDLLRKDSCSSQDERHKQIHMDVVPGTMELPGKKIQKQFEKAIDPSCATVKALLRAHDIT